MQPHQDTSLVVNTSSKLMFYLLHDANPNFLMKLLAFGCSRNLCFSWNSKLYYLIHRNPSVVNINQYTSAHTTISSFFTTLLISSSQLRLILLSVFSSVLIIKHAYLFLNQKAISCLPYFRLTTLHRQGQNLLVFY